MEEMKKCDCCEELFEVDELNADDMCADCAAEQEKFQRCEGKGI